MKSLNVKLTAGDGIEVAGTYIPGSLPSGVVMLHMMPATRRSYDGLGDKLAEAGFHTMAIDLRGHGDSGGGDYMDFSDAQHQKAILDVKAAVDFLKKQNPDMGIGFVGASIGANLALQYAAANPVAFLALLSPGISYRGIEGGKLSTLIPDDVPTYFVTALDDGRVEGNSSQTETIYNACASRKKWIKVFKEGGHGTEILSRNPDFATTLLEWVKQVPQT
jgi:pimeloyl-ACP methyl ester carboxylesterase